ncbi:PPC domain-containing DNA-binding protein [Streptomyces sp. NPDC008313]|uniref:PPC domain-containing DNA-binding protein n=1 Tax=Streptomyces sp. NPDC008313 TaxID=3364826 RepID=UPI0036E986F7
MRSHRLTTGHTYGLRLDPGEDFLPALRTFCHEEGIEQGYVPMFLAAFSEVEVVGTCEKLENPSAPVWSTVHLTNVEAIGCGTLAHDPETGLVLPHIHTSVGLKERSATGFTSHLLSARIQFIAELVVVQVTSPRMGRPADPGLYDVPRLTFGTYDLP